MRILSHRGYWQTPEEKNSEVAFQRSFELGFGTETDIRDARGQLVISHDLPNGQSLSLECFCTLYKQYGAGLPLALNIKADGLQALLKDTLAQFDITNYFVFDMSVPDTRAYLAKDMQVFTRQSEYEPIPPFYSQAVGVWIDCFEGEWIASQTIREHLLAGKEVCLVSPELHHRPYEAFWNLLQTEAFPSERGLMLCTDFPEVARRFFYGEN